MVKRAWLKSIEDLLEWGIRTMSDDEVDYGELINLFGEFDNWAAESVEDEQRIEKEMKPIADKMVKNIEKYYRKYYYPECKSALRYIAQNRITAGKIPIRWYWKIFEQQL